MTESQLQKKIMDLLTNNGYKVFKAMTSSINGVSDIVGTSPTGLSVAIEVKAPGKLKTVSKLQEHYLDAVRCRGGIAILADSVKIVEDALGLRAT